MAIRSCGWLTTLLGFVVTSLSISSLGVADEQPPRQCEQDASADTGQPVMLQRGRLIWGLSTKPTTFGQKLPVVLWLYNPTDEPLYVGTCDDIDFFWLREIQVFDSAGKRVEGRAEKRWAEEERSRGDARPLLREPFECFRNFTITVLSQACLHGSFSTNKYDFVRDLNDYYLLPPGRYSLVPTKAAERTVPVAGTKSEPKVALEIIVRKP